MKKILFRVSDRRMAFALGIVLFGLELVIFISLLVLNSSSATKILSMISADYLGGRLAFIGVGMEFEFPTPLIIFIFIFHNTTYLLIVNSLIVFLWEKTEKWRITKHFIESIQKKAKGTTQAYRKWNWFSISLFVWLPFPMTGAVMGSLIAHIEGYNIKDAFLMVVPSMWIGVICWTLWFDELYEWLETFGTDRTIFLTIFLLISPVLYYLLKNTIKKLLHKTFND